VVDIKPVRPLKRRVALAEIKATPELAEIPLVKQSRLSVIPLEKGDFERLITLGGGA
jgi:predicted RNA-binding protein with PUA-like domain